MIFVHKVMDLIQFFYSRLVVGVVVEVLLQVQILKLRVQLQLLNLAPLPLKSKQVQWHLRQHRPH